MKRREFIAALGVAAAWPFAAHTQQTGRMRRVGVLVHGLQNDVEWQGRLEAFRRGLERFGWLEGRNILIEPFFSANNFDRLPQFAQEIVALNPDVIFATTTPATKALQQVTGTIPIVFVQVSDPIGSGVITSLARPGGNITGVLLYEETIAGKWLGMFKEISPHLKRSALVGNPKGFPYLYFIRTANAIAPSLGMEIVPVPITNAADIERSIGSFARVPDGGLFLPPDNTVEEHRDLIIALAARNRLPAVYSSRYFVTSGGLMSYGTDLLNQYRQAASYVDRILRGAKPADLPVEMPTKYETVLNLKTAKSIGLEVPPTLLVRADEVIE
jgi:putative tryptophan/tyrosine transport system substrate-binding protein